MNFVIYDKYDILLVECDTGDGLTLERCYKFYDINRVYVDAQNYCKAQGGYVMEIASNAENDDITDILHGK